MVVRVGGCDDEEGEDLALLTRQLAAFSTSEQSNSVHDSHGELSVCEADSTSFQSDNVGSSPPPPSPVNCLPLAAHHQETLLTHPLSSLPCEMDDQPTSPAPSFHNPSPQP